MRPIADPVDLPAQPLALPVADSVDGAVEDGELDRRGTGIENQNGIHDGVLFGAGKTTG
jgi:hypothetical protein